MSFSIAIPAFFTLLSVGATESCVGVTPVLRLLWSALTMLLPHLQLLSLKLSTSVYETGAPTDRRVKVAVISPSTLEPMNIVRTPHTGSCKLTYCEDFLLFKF